MTTQSAKATTFRALHARPGAFVIPNPWDAGTARILTALGFEALATTSAGFAFALGRRDGQNAVTRDETLDNVRAIVEATELPVSADLANGFGDSPETVAETIRLAAQAGLVGGSIEDATGLADDPIYPLALSVERVAAAVEAARKLPFDFVVTARAENFLHRRPDLEDTIARLQAYERAGADVLFAPGLLDLGSIRAVCAAVSRPVNVLVPGKAPIPTVAELADAGVRRISLGSSMSRAALGALVRGAREIQETGTFEFVKDGLPFPDVSAMMG